MPSSVTAFQVHIDSYFVHLSSNKNSLWPDTPHFFLFSRSSFFPLAHSFLHLKIKFVNVTWSKSKDNGLKAFELCFQKGLYFPETSDAQWTCLSSVFKDLSLQPILLQSNCSSISWSNGKSLHLLSFQKRKLTPPKPSFTKIAHNRGTCQG